MLSEYRSLILIATLSLASPCFAAESCDSALIDGARYHVPEAIALIAHDVDFDDRPDLIAATRGSNVLTVLSNHVDGFFRTTAIVVGHPVDRLFQVDVDGDGTEEIVAAGGVTISTLFASSDGTFPVVASAANLLANISAIGDLTNDGKVDLAAIGSDQILRVYGGSGDGRFTLIGTSPAPISTRSLYSMAAAELTGDMKGDLVILGDFGTAIFPGNSDGTFGAQRKLIGWGYFQVATGDFDGDARADILVLGHGAGRFFSSTNGHATSTVSACVGTAQTVDLDGDGKLDTVSDLLEICRGNGNGTFDQRWDGATYFLDRVSANHHTVSVADFDGDGKLDVAGVTSDEDVAIFHGKPNLQLSGSQDYPSGSYSYYAYTGDLNGDGRDDIITSGAEELYVNVAQPDGTFTRTTTYSGIPGPSLPADLNGDTKLDLFLGWATLIGRGDGTFQFRVMPIEEDFGDFATTDLNGDQKPDLVGWTALGTHAKVVVWLSNQSGTMSKSSYPTEPFAIVGLSVADVTGDSIPDVLMVGVHDNTKQGLVRMMPGQAGGTLGPSVVIADGVVSNDVLAAPFDDDATADLVFAVKTATAGDVLLVLRATGNGTFTERQRILLPADSDFGEVRLAAGDFNGDGRRDITVKISDAAVTWVLLQNSQSMFALRWTFPNGMDNGPVTAGDFNNDGVDDLVVITAFSSMDVHMSACSDMLPAVPPRVHLIGPARSAKNQPVTFTALLDSPEAHGSVAFYSEDRAGDNLLGTAPVLLEQAALTLLFPDLGERKIYAIYMGEGRQARAMSSVIAHDVVDPSELPRRRAVRR